MTREETTRFAELAVRIARCQPEWTPERCADLAECFWSVAGRCSAFAEAVCNRPVTAAEETRDEQRRANLRRLATEHGFDVRFQNDPRGYVVRLVFPGDTPEGRGVR